jgi:hypothetical protein
LPFLSKDTIRGWKTTRSTWLRSSANLNPSLFPHDADFFRVQFQATVFDKLIAASLRWTHIPLEWGILFWQFGATLSDFVGLLENQPALLR